MEYLIKKQNTYVYPILRAFDEAGRYKFYGVVAVGILFIFVLSVLLIKVISGDRKRKSKKEKSKNKKQAAQPQKPVQAPQTGRFCFPELPIYASIMIINYSFLF